MTAFDTRLTGPLTVTFFPNDEGHLSVALEVSVGRFAGLLQVPRLVGLDSGGGIRTRDLRVMSPTALISVHSHGYAPVLLCPGTWIGVGTERRDRCRFVRCRSFARRLIAPLHARADADNRRDVGFAVLRVSRNPR
jgi:hypothetical protein